MRFSCFLMIVFVIPVLFSCQRIESLSSSVTLREPNTSSIIGGDLAGSSEFPFMVNVWLNSPQDSFVDHLCGASLIHPKWVLTAAHCLLDDDSESTQTIIKPNKLILYIGSDEISGTGGRRLKVKSVIVHPDFAWPHHDVGLIELATPVFDIKPVLLFDQDTETFLSSRNAVNATVIGWGLMDQEGQTSSEFLRKITLPLISRKACGEDSFTIKSGYTITSDILCAGTTQNQRASCPGDSGGPLLISVSGQYMQIGIVSWGSACSGNPPRIRSNIEGHASVSDAYSWIWDVINSRGG